MSISGISASMSLPLPTIFFVTFRIYRKLNFEALDSPSCHREPVAIKTLPIASWIVARTAAGSGPDLNSVPMAVP